MYGLAILFKQTSGIILSVIFIGYKILEIDKASEIKQFLKIALARALGVLMPVLVFVVYLIVTNTYMEFIDYAILGIGTFSNSSSYLSLLKSSQISIKILAIIVPIVIITMLIICIFILAKRKLFKDSFIRSLYILFAYSIADITAIYPIADVSHFGVGAICTIISIIYLTYNLIYILCKHIKYDKIIFAIKTFVEALSILIFIIYIWYSITLLSSYIKNLPNNKNLKHFNGIPTDESLYSEISDIGEYLLEKEQEGKTVYILDTMSAIITIPIDKYYKNYDMFNLGNFGKRGEDGIIEDLKNTENLLVLIRKEGLPKNWQHPYKVTDYAIENFDRIDEIAIFDVYEK